MEGQELPEAARHFTRAIEIDPKCAEAYKQRAIAHSLLEDFDESIDDRRRTTELMACHSGASAGMGHCHAHTGRLQQALKCYQKAFSITPHLECLVEACEELKGQDEGD